MDQDIPSNFAFCGEIGLSGEIRGVSRVERRIIEAEKLGFKCMIIPNRNLKSVEPGDYKIDIIGLDKLQDLRDMIFNGD
jgi:DNA repair protein RadA/Sms